MHVDRSLTACFLITAGQGIKIKKATAFIAMAFIYMMITDYSALGVSSVVSAAGAAGAL